jgi:hypothetical protein
MATTTPNYGWPVPTDTDYVKDGAAAIEALGDAIDATVFGLGAGALTFIKSQVVGTAVSSVAVTDAFSADYNDYRITYSGGVGNAFGPIGLQLTGSTTGYYSSIQANNYTNGGSTVGGVSNGSSFEFLGYKGTATASLFAELYNPFNALRTQMTARPVSDTGNNFSGSTGGFHNVASSYTGFSIIPQTGTLTGGTIYIYGYAKA